MAPRSLHLPIVLDIPVPCSEQWSEMSGDARTRHCAHCDKQIHNLSELRQDEIAELLSRPDVCISLQVDAEGALVTASADAKKARNGGRAGRIVVTAALAALAACGRTSGDPLPSLSSRTSGSPIAVPMPSATTSATSELPTTAPTASATAASSAVPEPIKGRIAPEPMHLAGKPVASPQPPRLTGKSPPPHLTGVVKPFTL